MRLKPVLLMLLVLGSAAAGRERSPAGLYRLVGEPEAASQLLLRPDGRFRYFLSVGALDEQAEGRWTAEDRVVTLVTEPKPVPPVFSPGRAGIAEGTVLSVRVSSPSGDGIAGVDLRIGFDEGPPVEGYTQEDGWSLPPDETRTPRWIELGVPMHGLASPRLPVETASGNALAFTLIPNDLGVLDFAGIRIETADRALIVQRGEARLRYEAVDD
jgi:hypothetical protein